MAENIDLMVEQLALREQGILGRAGPYGNTLFAFEYDLLPPEAKQVIEHIAAGGPFLYPQHDGRLYGNRSQDLPGYAEYREFTVPTPNATNRGKRRIVARANGLIFFTACHYDRVSGRLGSEAHSSGIAAIDAQWRNGFYAVTGMHPSMRARIAASLKLLHDSRLPSLYTGA